ncbi:hypothetical protein B0J13DRAFT_527197 [Dactylonectria estremocensis]|uniref:Uncharacterized protein n=1 Tax=Dactylonectria estremocensis TaxID=1079267 RepID=A0A9P9ENR3_9HYPO|nr:hypothetical protein B0J13DRAFT_527197 [Dactylonectria estremocensis]
MPSWCQRNVISWVRICGPDWNVRVLDMVSSSPNHALKFAERELLPEAFVNGTMDGLHVGQHSADFIRGPLLFRYGGVSMEVGCILVKHIDRICWDTLADPGSPYEIAVPVLYGQTIANHFVAARKENPFIEKWQVETRKGSDRKITRHDLGTNCLCTFGRAERTPRASAKSRCLNSPKTSSMMMLRTFTGTGAYLSMNSWSTSRKLYAGSVCA